MLKRQNRQTKLLHSKFQAGPTPFVLILVSLWLVCCGGFFSYSLNPARAARERLSVNVGAYDNAPKIFMDANGNINGFWPELLAQIAKEENWKINYIHGTWKQGLERLQKKQIDIMPDVAFSKQRSRLYDFSKEPVLLSWSRIYVHPDNTRIQSITDLEDKTIGALEKSINLEGSGGLKELVTNFNVNCRFETFDNYDQVFKALEDKQIDAGITNRNFGNKNAGNYLVKKTGIIFQPININFAFPKNHLPAAHLAERIDYHIHKLKTDDRSIYYTLLEKYFEGEIARKEIEVLPVWVKLLVSGLILLAAVFLLAVLISRYQIRKKIKEIRVRDTALFKGEERYREIFNSTSDSITIHDLETGRILDANTAACTLLGYSFEELLSLDIDVFFSQKYARVRDHLPIVFTQVFENGPLIFEWFAKKKDQSFFWVEVGLKHTRIMEKEAIIAVARDINQRKESEAALLKIKKLESLGVLAGGIAHDFNNILSAILGNINLATLKMDEENPIFRLLKNTEKAVVRAEKLTQQLLVFSKGGNPVRETTSVRHLIRESADFVLHGSNVACSYHFKDDLWLVDIDTGQIGQVIQNLVINACHAMPNGGNINIRCSNVMDVNTDNPAVFLSGPHIKISIQDEGTGIPQNIMDKIFDPFFTTKDQGSGLGLATTHSIIKKHKGQITVTSNPAQGSCFTIFLPASSNREKKVEKKSSLPSTPGHLNFLVMDDEEMIRAATRDMLFSLGHDAFLAKNGEEAISAYRRFLDQDRPFDLVIMDLTVPGGMGGVAATQKIIAMHPDAKIILVSGYSNDSVVSRYKEYGFCAAISKPYGMDDLISTLNQVL